MRCFPQKGCSVPNFIRAFLIFRANIEQSDTRLGNALGNARIGRAHDRKFNEIAGVAFGVRPQIEHDEIIFTKAGQQRGQSGPINAGHGAQSQLGHCH